MMAVVPAHCRGTITALCTAALCGASGLTPVRAQDSALSAALAMAQAGVAALREGRHAEAAAKLEAAAPRLSFHPGVVYRAALAYAGAGNPRRAVHWLGRGAELGLAYAVDTVQALDPIRNRADFRAVRARLEANRRPLVRSTVALTVRERDLMPESVAYDSAGDVFYLGSIYRRKIVRVLGEGRTEDWVSEGRDGLWGVLGMKIDARRRELWANACNLGREMPMARPDSATVGQGGIFRFDLATGRLVRRYVAGSAADTVCFNDLTLTRTGDVYVSSGSDGVWRVTAASDSLEQFVATPELMVNGIALSSDGTKLYLADANFGVLVLDLASRRYRPVALPPAVTLNGIDGLYVHRNALIGIQNGVTPERVVHATLDASGSRVERFRVLEAANPLFDIPTTGVITGDSLYFVATAQLDRLDSDGRILPRDQLRDNLVLRLPLLPN